MATNHIQILAQVFSWSKSAYLLLDKHKLVLSLATRDMAVHQICEMKQSQEIRNGLVDVIMLICHITSANLDFIMMHVYLQESLYIWISICICWEITGIFKDRLNYPTLPDISPSSEHPNL